MGVADTEPRLYIAFGDRQDGPYSEAQLLAALPHLPPGVRVWLNERWIDLPVGLQILEDGRALPSVAAVVDAKADKERPSSRSAVTGGSDLGVGKTRWLKVAMAIAAVTGLVSLGAAIADHYPGTQQTASGQSQALDRQASSQSSSEDRAPQVDPYGEAAMAVKAACSDHAAYLAAHKRDETYIPGLIPLTYQLSVSVGPYRHVSPVAGDLAAIWGAIYLNAQDWEPGDLEDVAAHERTMRIVNDERDALHLCSSTI